MKNSTISNRKGQAALIMVLIAAMALIFYAIELNWSRIADLKARTWMAATSAASSVASNFASVGEQVLQQQFNPLKTSDGPEYHNPGEIVKWDRTWLPLKILILIVVVVIIIFVAIWTGGAALALLPYVLALVIGMFVASMILEYAVITPGELAMWNKLQQNMQPVDRFREGGISSGLSMMVGDTVNIPDRFDMNGNGVWGFDIGGKAKDAISRFNFYYTERLKTIAPPDTSAITTFLKALNNFINNPSSSDPAKSGPDGTVGAGGLGFTPMCTDVYKLAPLCDAQCTGISNRPAPAVNSWWASSYNRVGWRGTSSIDYVPFNCSSSPVCSSQCSNPLSGSPASPCCQGALLYDPSLQASSQPASSQASPLPVPLLTRLGNDDEWGKEQDRGQTDPQRRPYNPSNASHDGVVFPMLQGMENVGKDTTTLPVFTPSIGLPPQTDSVAAIQNFKADDTACAESADSSKGFYWKPGADRYCSGTVQDKAYYVNGQSEYYRLAAPPNGIGNVSFSSPTLSHFPYYDCTYMHDSSGNRVPCEKAGQQSLHPKANWPQDRLDDMVYGLHDLITLDKSLQGQSADTVNQWYPQAAAFIAPQCCDPATNKNCTDPFAINPLTCNPNRPGSLVQFRDEAKSWNKLMTDWLGSSFGDSSHDLCYGTLPHIVDCLSDNLGTNGMSSYLTNLTQCASSLPATIPGVTLLPACTNLIQTASSNPALFVKPVSTLSPDITAGTTSISDPTVLTNFTQWVQYNMTKLGQRSIEYSTLQQCSYVLPKQLPAYTLSSDCTNLIQKASGDSALFIPPISTVPNITAGTTSISDPTVLTNFTQWVQTNIKWKTVAFQRYSALHPLLMNAKEAQTLFQEAHTDFDAFLSGPAQNFMQAYLNAQAPSRLPPFAIYGWRDKQRISNNEATIKGNWHLARVEVVQPTQLPWLHAWEDFCVGFDWTAIFLGPVDICDYYQFERGAGPVWVRVTRWDQGSSNQGGLVSFANKIPLWQFRYTNPHPPTSTVPSKPVTNNSGNCNSTNPTAADIEQCCTTGSQSFGSGIGITQYTQDALEKVFPSEPSLTIDEKDSYQNAFMINIDPRASLPQTQYMGNCKTWTYQPNSSSCDSNQWQNCCCQAYSSPYYTNYYRNPTNVINCASYTSPEIVSCKKYNQNLCETNNKLEGMKDQTTKCFSTVDTLLNQGVGSIAGASFGVPDTGANNYHEQVYFNNAKGASAFTPASCKGGNPINGTTTYGDCTF